MLPSQTNLNTAILSSLTLLRLSAASLYYVRPSKPNVELTMAIDDHVNSTSDAIPGGSPFFYMADPKNNGFQIESITVTPTPCQIGLPCIIEAKGALELEVSKIDLDFEIEARFKGGHTGKVLTRKDDLCDWATVRQGGRVRCPPGKGAVTITTELLLAPIFVPEATYDIDLSLKAGLEMLTHVGARVKLEDADKS